MWWSRAVNESKRKEMNIYSAIIEPYSCQTRAARTEASGLGQPYLTPPLSLSLSDPTSTGCCINNGSRFLCGSHSTSHGEEARTSVPWRSDDSDSLHDMLLIWCPQLMGWRTGCFSSLLSCSTSMIDTCDFQEIKK